MLVKTKDFLTEEGMIKIVKWGINAGITPAGQEIVIPLGERPTPMAHSNATGAGLLSNGIIGVDLIRLEANDGFVPHTHPGDHLLICVGGKGTITYDGYVYPTQAGEVYMIEGSVPHAVGAITDHAILAVGAPHKPIDSTERMTPVEYQSVAAELGSLHCLVCDNKAQFPKMLHDVGCDHCPCEGCNPY